MVQAQTVDLADLEACAALESDARKLACFEAIAVSSRPAAAPAPQPPDEAAPAEEPVEAPSALADVAPSPGPVQTTGSPEIAAAAVAEPPSESSAPAAAVAETASPEPPPAPEPTRERSAPAAPPASPTPAPAAPEPAQPASTPEAVVAETPETAADDFGREHLERVEDPERESLNARVVEVTKTGYGELVFHLDNGQVWRQQEKRYYPYPRNREFDVTISRGILGEYQLQVEGSGRKVTIRRIR